MVDGLRDLNFFFFDGSQGPSSLLVYEDREGRDLVGPRSNDSWRLPDVPIAVRTVATRSPVKVSSWRWLNRWRRAGRGTDRVMIMVMVRVCDDRSCRTDGKIGGHGAFWRRPIVGTCQGKRPLITIVHPLLGRSMKLGTETPPSPP